MSRDRLGKIHGSKERPRLRVYRSLRHIYCQLIDDDAKMTLVGASDMELAKKPTSPIDRARAVGMLLSKKATEKKIKACVFDRGQFAYHGQIQALAEGARTHLKF